MTGGIRPDDLRNAGIWESKRAKWLLRYVPGPVLRLAEDLFLQTHGLANRIETKPVLRIASSGTSPMTEFLNEYFQSSVPLAFEFPEEELGESGYFRFGSNTVCFGRTLRGYASARPDQQLYDAAEDVKFEGNIIRLPFDPVEVVTNLRRERYTDAAGNGSRGLRRELGRRLYYLVRPVLPLQIRSEMQRIYLRNRRNLTFPSWPVDCTVDVLLKKLLLIGLNGRGLERIPFVWFWPDGASACSIMTHDVEHKPGKQFCSALMDIDDEFGIPASFGVVPERRYPVSDAYIGAIKARGFEVNIQDLDHDGRLFWDYEQFKRRVQRINQYGHKFGAAGFRSAVMYHNQEWYEHFDFEYDMSVPNVAHLDPQYGGCCTVMPYFVGHILELPLTTCQDHSLFHILKDYSTDLWRQQIDLILQHNGLISFIVHPDYLIAARAQVAYRELLAELSRLRSERHVWIAQPQQVNRWWRRRAAMQLVSRNGKWAIEGQGKERARIAFATVNENKLSYTIAESDCVSEESLFAHSARSTRDRDKLDN